MSSYHYGDGHLPLLRLWETGLHDLLDDTENFPKRIRYSFVSRIDNHALDVLEQLQLARYSTQHNELHALITADQALAKLKILLRVSYTRKYMSQKRYERHVTCFEEAGRMIGGWIKSCQN